MTEQQSATGKKVRKFWLYAPVIALVLIMVGWSVAWFMIRDRVERALDERMVLENRAGRMWNCPLRSISGFPFRIEVTCADLTLTRGDVSLSLGRMQAIVQAYNPNHGIVTLTGPLRFDDGRISISGTWQEWEASVVGLARGRLERLAMAATNPIFTISGLPEMGDVTASADSTETHIRPTPGAAEQDRSYDVSFDATGTVLPLFDNWLSDTSPGSISTQFTGTQLSIVGGRSVAEAAEQWRMDGGKISISSLSITKGARRLDLKGEGKLDPMHRPEALLTISAANFSDLLARMIAGNGNAPLEPLSPEASKAPLVPLPPVRFQDGKIYVGPFVVPKVRLAPGS